EIPAGEFVFGQVNTYGTAAQGPLVVASALAEQFLPKAGTEGLYDLGRNGTYMVTRELKQDVAGFWQDMRKNAGLLLDGGGKPASDTWVAQKAIGRTLSGEMLAPGKPKPGNDMTFFADDRAGFGCPITSHVRRANPRDGLAPKSSATREIIQAANRHRIVRRGRIYGEPILDRYTDDGV